MKKRLLTVLILVIVSNYYAYSQTSLIGIKTGLINYNFLLNEYPNQKSDFYLGLNYEYTLFNALFSVSSEIQYVFDKKWLLIPLSINLKPGKRFKFILSQGIVPVFRIDYKAPENSIDLGGMLGIGIDYSNHNNYSFYGKFGLMLIPDKFYMGTHFGGRFIDRNLEIYQFISFGINYSIDKKMIKY